MSKLTKNRIFLTIGIILSIFFLIHNLVSYPSSRGYVYSLHVKYAEVISHEWRLPTFEETQKVYDPPLFFILSGLFTRLTSQISGEDFTSAIKYWRYFSILFPIFSFYFWYKIIKKLMPKNRQFHLFFIIILFSLPVLHKTLVMYTIEPFLFFTTSLTLWYFIFKFQPKPNIKTTFILSCLVTISLLTRVSAIALLCAIIFGILGLAWIRQISWKQLIKFLTIFLLTVFLGAGWFYGRESKDYNDRISIMMNRNKDPASVGINKKLDFLTEIPFHLMMTHPIRRPVWLNRLIPIYYSEFWGDFWNFYIQKRFNISFEARQANRLITTPKRVASLALQNQVNLISTFLMIVGFIYLTIRTIKKSIKKPDFRWVIETMLLVVFIVTWLGFLYSITYHGAPKGDSIKATYMLFILPIFVYMLILFLFEVVKKAKYIFLPLILWLALATGVNLWWSWY